MLQELLMVASSCKSRSSKDPKNPKWSPKPSRPKGQSLLWKFVFFLKDLWNAVLTSVISDPTSPHHQPPGTCWRLCPWSCPALSVQSSTEECTECADSSVSCSPLWNDDKLEASERVTSLNRKEHFRLTPHCLVTANWLILLTAVASLLLNN